MIREPRIKLYYTYREEISAGIRDRWLEEIPYNERRRLGRFEDRERKVDSLLGHQLLKWGAGEFGLVGFDLRSVSFTQGRKPAGIAGIDFSIAHSNGLTVCAMVGDGAVGVDVERRGGEVPEPVPCMSEDELMGLDSHPRLFYSYWTRKEAVCKGADCGGLAGMKRVQLAGDRATLDGTIWYLRGIDVEPGYSLSVATTSPQARCDIQHMSVAALMAPPHGGEISHV